MTDTKIVKVLTELDKKQITYDLVKHPQVFTIDDMLSFDLPKEEWIAKNLFIRDDKKKNYYLFVIREEKRINLKELRTTLKTRPLTFASEKDLFNILGLPKGSVTPFGLMNNEGKEVHVYFDEEFINSEIGVHPNDNSATIFLKTQDLIECIEAYAQSIAFIKIN